MHFIFSRLVENVLELKLELTLSKADNPYHLNELYVHGHYRTVTRPVTWTEVSRSPDVTLFHHEINDFDGRLI